MVLRKLDIYMKKMELENQLIPYTKKKKPTTENRLTYTSNYKMTRRKCG